MGNLQVEGSSIAGRMASGAAKQVEQNRLKKKRRKENAEMIRIITQLREVLLTIDHRLDTLSQDIADLQNQLSREEQQSQEAFDRMHDLKSIMDEINRSGWNDEKREQLRDALDLDPNKTIDDVDLKTMTEERITQERTIGMEASERAEDIREKIEAKKKVRAELEQAKKEILSDPNLSAEEKTSRLQEALEKSLEQDVDGVQMSQEADIKEALESAPDNGLVAETQDSDFEFDEDQEVVLTVKPDEPGFR